MAYHESSESSLVCLDRYCPKVFDPHRNIVMCRCHQIQVTSPTSTFGSSATGHGSPTSGYPGSMQFGENLAAPCYPAYPGYTCYDGCGMYQNPYQQSSPTLPGAELAMYNAYHSQYAGHPGQMEHMLRSQVNEFLNYQQLNTQINGNDIPATKQSTKVLKTWMREHRKNPYPTKTEKVMLAFATRMTMTQISNWFANARRRMKQQKDKGNTSDGALSDLSDDDERSATSRSPADDISTSSHNASDSSSSPSGFNLTELVKERDNILRTHRPMPIESKEQTASPVTTENTSLKPPSSPKKPKSIWSVTSMLG